MTGEGIRGKVLALTGHRELPSDFDKNKLCDRLEVLIGEGYDYFLCGMAQGFDLKALECLVFLSRKYRLTIEACIPFEGQEKKFSKEDQKLYRQLLEFCNRKTVLCEGFRRGCFLLRDRYMVDSADGVFAYCVKQTGGTAYTVEYAKRKNVPVCYFEP